MVFRSTGLLEKHKVLFCIGSESGGLRVQRHSSEDVPGNGGGGIDPKEARRSPELVQMRGQQRNIVRRRSVDAEPKSGRKATSQTNSAALQNLKDEFHNLRTSIQENMSNWSKRTTDTEVSGRQLGHSERLQQMREMAMLHERQLALIRVQHQQLEQQRDELAHQVRALSEQSNTTHLEHLLMELREQEERNEETLQQLAEHLHALHVQQVSVPADQPEPVKNEKMQQVNYKLISSEDGPLSTQIKALRHAYMHSGGSDPAIVSRMIDLQAEAQSLEKNQSSAAAKPKKKKVKPPLSGPSWELLAVERENQRLEEEILRMQLARVKHHNYEGATTELDLIQQETHQQIISLQAEMERNKEALRPLRWHRPPPHKLQTKSPPSLTMSSSPPFGRGRMEPPLDLLGPAPYDPAAGFVVFFDLVMGVDVSQRALRLVAALYSEGHIVRTLTPMSPVQCLLGGSVPYPYGLFSVKQPVPRIQPSPSLCLVVEVQAARDVDVFNQEVLELVSCGWTQLELFDQYNQLRSGFWRVPVRSLPVRPSLGLAQLNSIPQVGNMELCVRLVNGRDGDAQTAAKADPISIGLYKYPAVGSSFSVYGNEALPTLAPQSTEVVPRSSSQLFADRTETPPTDKD
ncbi:hypothetical protein Q8A73_009229 [Channa argus]|nr:hypothetical protein Q8A73_009229 [Channa argus]